MCSAWQRRAGVHFIVKALALQPIFIYDVNAIIFCSRSAPSSPNQAGMSGIMTPESLSREGSPGPEGIHLHPAPPVLPNSNQQPHHPSAAANNGVIMGSDNPAQVVASHLEVKTNNFPPGVSHPVLTGAQSKFDF